MQSGKTDLTEWVAEAADSARKLRNLDQPCTNHERKTELIGESALILGQITGAEGES